MLSPTATPQCQSWSARPTHQQLNCGPALSKVGVAFVAFGIIYTPGILLACIYLFMNANQHHCIRVRGGLLVPIAILLLYGYLAGILTVYNLNGAFACKSEFWIMNTMFPAGEVSFNSFTVSWPLSPCCLLESMAVSRSKWSKGF